MEGRHEQNAEISRRRAEALGADDLWGLLAGGEPWRLDGVEWLLDWIEGNRGDRR